MSHYRPGQNSKTERERIIRKLLEVPDKMAELDKEDIVHHPVVRDEPPDLYIAGEGLVPYVKRQWSVTIGGAFYCEVGLWRINNEGQPEFIVMDVEPLEEEGTKGMRH